RAARRSAASSSARRRRRLSALSRSMSSRALIRLLVLRDRAPIKPGLQPVDQLADLRLIKRGDSKQLLVVVNQGEVRQLAFGAPHDGHTVSVFDFATNHGRSPG